MSGWSLPMFRRIILPPDSGYKLHNLSVEDEDGSNMFPAETPVLSCQTTLFHTPKPEFQHRLSSPFSLL
jgi:hypothetical protein